jgi:hypothetical protein
MMSQEILCFGISVKGKFHRNIAVDIANNDTFLEFWIILGKGPPVLKNA